MYIALSKYFNKKLVYLFSFIYLLIYLLPSLSYSIYPDEIASLIWSTRFFIDNAFRTSIQPQCFNSFIAEIPLLLYPIAVILSSFSLIDDLRIFRFITFFLLYLLILISYKTFKGPNKNISFLLFLILGLTGTKLFGIVLFRGELFILITIILGYLVLENKNNLFYKCIFMLFYCCSLYMHPQSMFYLPAVLLLIYKNYFLSIYVFVFSIFSYQIWNFQLFKCDNLSFLNLNQSFNINITNIIREPFPILNEIINNLTFERLKIIFSRYLISGDYSEQVSYLPNFNLDNNLYIISNIITIIILITSFLFFIYFYAKQLLFINNNFLLHKKLYDVFILSGLFIHFSINKTNSFYFLSYVYYIIVYLFFKECICKIHFSFIYKYKKCLFIFIFIIVFFSLLLNYNIYKYVKYHTGPNLSILKRDIYSDIYREKLIDTIKKCCYDEKHESYAVDDSAYFLLKNYIKFPILVTYASIFGNEMEIYKIRNVKYIIARCDYIQHKYKNHIAIINIDNYNSRNNICIYNINN